MEPTPPLSKKRTHRAILAIMVVGFVLRVTALDLTAFNIDESILSIYANQIANAREFPLFGVKTSLGFHNPPLFVYLMAPFFFFTADPRFAMVGLAMAGAASVGLTGLAARRLWGGWAGVCAATLVGFSPMALEHCRRLWGHDTILFWSALTAYATITGIQSRRRAWLVVAMASAAAAQCCHLSGVLLWVIPLGALIAFKPPGRGKTLAMGLGILALFYLPWAVEDARQGFAEMRLIFGAMSGAGGPTGPPTQIPPGIAWLGLLGDAWHNDQLGPEYLNFLFELPARVSIIVFLQGLMIVLQICGLSTLLADARHRTNTDDAQARWGMILFAAALAPVVLFTLLPVSHVPPYQLPALVPLGLGASAFLCRSGVLLARLKRENLPRSQSIGVSRGVMGAIIAATIFCGTIYTLSVRYYLGQATFEQRVSSVLRYKLDAITFIVSSADGRSYSIMQDGRTTQTGIDFWVLYLHYLIAQDDQAPTLPGDLLYVIVDNKTVLRPMIGAWLRPRDCVEIGSLRVYQFNRADAAHWRALVNAFPPPKRPAED